MKSINPEKRNIFVRILATIFWFFTILVVGQTLLGIIFGGFVDMEGPGGGFEAGQADADKVQMVLEQKLGGLIFIFYLIEVTIFGVLLKLKMLPGTSKYK